jgi:hypothetical protein
MARSDDDLAHVGARLAGEDAAWIALHNAHARESARLHTHAGAVPFLGALATAPVVLLLSHPQLAPGVAPGDYRFARPGWPLAPLHPDAPEGLSRVWQRRLAPLVRRYGAQHVAHSIAAVFLNPWPSVAFDARLELPSRLRLHDLATRAAGRDAAFVIGPDADAWFDHPVVAALPPARRATTYADAPDELDAAIGADAWELLCARVGIHAWL